MSVAREMITELGLVDQDVNKVAEVFDDAIGFLVSDWRMGFTTDNAICRSENPRLLDVVNTENDLSSEHLPTMFIESPLVDQSQNSSMSWQQKHSDAPKPSQMEPTKHGRFKQMIREPPLAGDNCRAVTSTSSEESWGTLHSPSLGQSLDSECSFESSPFQDPSATISRGNANVLGQSTDLGLDNENGTSQKRASHYGSTPYANLARASDDNDYSLASWQLKELTLKQEQELEDLQYKHKEALLNFKGMSKAEVSPWLGLEMPSFLAVGKASLGDSAMNAP